MGYRRHRLTIDPGPVIFEKAILSDFDKRPRTRKKHNILSLQKTVKHMNSKLRLVIIVLVFAVFVYTISAVSVTVITMIEPPMSPNHPENGQTPVISNDVEHTARGGSHE